MTFARGDRVYLDWDKAGGGWLQRSGKMYGTVTTGGASPWVAWDPVGYGVKYPDPTQPCTMYLERAEPEGPDEIEAMFA